jgi:hypothetical protein
VGVIIMVFRNKAKNEIPLPIINQLIVSIGILMSLIIIVNKIYFGYNIDVLYLFFAMWVGVGIIDNKGSNNFLYYSFISIPFLFITIFILSEFFQLYKVLHYGVIIISSYSAILFFLYSFVVRKGSNPKPAK